MKHGGATNQQFPLDAHDKFASGSNKAAYSPPVLKVYGSVSRLTRGTGGSQADKSNMTKMAASDRSIKENIVRVGEHPLGIGLYLFDYKTEYREQWGSGRQFGVMADEVDAVMPEAVVVHPDGYKMVNYGLLGIYRTSE